MSVGLASPSGRARGGSDLRSTQRLALPDTPGAFERWGQPETLATMLRTYFSVAEKCAGRLVRMRWTEGRPTFVLAWTPLRLIAMSEPTYDLGADRRVIGVHIHAGLLAMPATQPRLEIALSRGQAGVEASVDLIDYQPRFGDRALVRWLYQHTQVLIHVWVGRRYLRQLRRDWSRYQEESRL